MDRKPSVQPTPRPPWTNRYKDNWDEAYARLMAWWAGDGLDRPIVVTSHRRPGAPKFQPTRDPGSPEARDLNEEYRLEANRYYLENRWFPAESAPYAGTQYASALGMLAAMVGARISYTPDTGTAWIQEEADVYDRPLAEFDPACPPYAFALRMLQRNHEAFGYDAILSTNDMLDPLTTLSMMRGAAGLCIDLLERPEAVTRWCDRAGELFVKIVTGLRQARAALGRSEHFNWTQHWAPGHVEALQCDFSAMLSPAMFRRFVLPEIERQAAIYDYALWHLDGEQEIVHLDDICSVPRIRAIQWVDGRKLGPLNYIDLFRKVRRLGRPLTLSVRSADEAVEVARRVGKDGLSFTLAWAPTEKELEDMLRRLKEV